MRTHDLLAACAALAAASLAALSSSCNGSSVVVCDGSGGRDADLCLGFATSSAPTIDGLLEDEAWMTGFRYVLGDAAEGSPVPSAILQGVSDSSYLYLSIEARNDPSFDSSDAIVIAFDPDEDPANYRRIHIYPVADGTVAGTAAPDFVEYWRGYDATSGWGSADPLPAWLASAADIRVRAAIVDPDPTSPSVQWQVELRIPITAVGGTDTGINLPAADDFGFYVNTVVTEKPAFIAEWLVEHAWPADALLDESIDDTPAAVAWGNAHRGKVLNGVSISSSDIQTNHSPTSAISLTTPNVFTANVKNAMVDAAGTPILASQVNASFRIANWGIPSATSWGELASSPTGFHDVPAGGEYPFQVSWTLSGAEQTAYSSPNDHQCIRVEIDSNGPNTLITNRRAQRNMNFVTTASPFERRAELALSGHPRTKLERQAFTLASFFYNTPPEAKWKGEILGDGLTGPGAYVQLDAPLDAEKPFELRTVIDPPPIQIPLKTGTVAPRQDPNKLAFAVEAGNLITLLGSGSIQLRREGPLAPPIGPEGIDLGEEAGRELALGELPLERRLAPEARLGALIGSFDGFQQSSFAIGAGRTYVVPSGAQKLSIGINDSREGRLQQSGDGFEVEVIQTPPRDEFRFTSPHVTAKQRQRLIQLPLGQNLPTAVVRAYLDTGTTLEIRGQKLRRFLDVGSFGYVVKRIGQ